MDNKTVKGLIVEAQAKIKDRKEAKHIFRLPLDLYRKLKQGRKLLFDTHEHLKKPIGLKRFRFREGRIIKGGIQEDKEQEPLFARIIWDPEGTGFKLKPLTSDYRV